MRISDWSSDVCSSDLRDNGLDYGRDQITVNVGGKHTLFNALVATVDPGDEVIIPAPYWVSYPDIVAFAGGTPVTIEASTAQNYKITPAQPDEIGRASCRERVCQDG